MLVENEGDHAGGGERDHVSMGLGDFRLLAVEISGLCRYAV